MTAALRVRAAFEAVLPGPGAEAIAGLLGLGGPSLSLRAAGARVGRSGERVRQLLARLRAGGPLLGGDARAEIEVALAEILPSPAAEVAVLLGGPGSDPRRLGLVLSLLGLSGIAVVEGIAMAIEDRPVFLAALDALRAPRQPPLRRALPGGARLGPLAAAVAGWQARPEGWIRLDLSPGLALGLRRAISAANGLAPESLPAVAGRLRPELRRVDGRLLAEVLVAAGVARLCAQGRLQTDPCPPTPLEARLLEYLRACGPLRRADLLLWASSAGLSTQSVSDLLRRSPVVAPCARGWYVVLGASAVAPPAPWAVPARPGVRACRRTATAAALRTGVVASPRGAALPEGVFEALGPDGSVLGRIRIGGSSISGLRAPLRRLGLQAGQDFLLELSDGRAAIRPL